MQRVLGLAVAIVFAPVAAIANPPATESQVKRIAVLDFVDLGPSVELAPLRFAFAEMLTTELSGYRGLKLVERTGVEDLLREKDLGKGAVTDELTHDKPQEIEADYLINGTFSSKDGVITIELQVLRFPGKAPLLEEKSTAKPGDLPQVAETFASHIRESLQVAAPAVVSPPEGQQSTPTVAILGFRNLSPKGDDADLVDALPDLLQTSLSVVPEIILVDRTRVQEVLREQKLSLSGEVDESAKLRIGKLLGAQRLVFGSLTHLGDQLRVDVRVADTASAQVSCASQVTMPSDGYPQLLEELTKKLTAAFAITLSPETQEAIHAVAPSSNRELQVHLASAERSLLADRRSDALAHFERALLLDPKNMTAIIGRLDILIHTRQFPQAIEAATQALNQEFSPSERVKRRVIAYELASIHFAMNQLDDVVAICKKMQAEGEGLADPNERSFANLLQSVDWIQGNSGRQLEKLESAYQEARKKNNVYAEGRALQQLFVAWFNSLPPGIAHAAKATPEIRRKRVERLIELYAEILKLGSQPNLIWKEWHHNAVGYAIHYGSAGDERMFLRVFTPEEEENRVRETLKAFAWDFSIKYKCLEWLAQRMEMTGRPTEALECYRELESMTSAVKSTGTITLWQLPVSESSASVASTDSAGERIIRKAKIAVLQEQVHGDKAKLIETLTALATAHGFLTPEGLFIAEELAKAGASAPRDAPCALIWGGGNTAARSWNRFLQPFGVHAHEASLNYVTAADLEPYSLVVLQRHGGIPFTPQGVLAIRSFVARGGSLLVIPEPGWDAASPGILNPLLAFFGVRVEGTVVLEAQATPAAEHPITKGLSKAMARNAAPLTLLGASPLQAIAASKDGNMIAAGNYRQGRIVVASFGQWWLPDHDVKDKKNMSVSFDWNMKTDIELTPFEIGARLEPDLLKSVVGWLIEPEKERHSRPLQQEFAAANQVAREVMLNVRPQQDLRVAMDHLIASADDRELGEEAIWVAALAFDPYYWARNCDANRKRFLGLNKGQSPRPLAPEYFELLLQQYPDSELRPYAEWFLADTKRREAVAKQFDPAGCMGYHQFRFYSVEESLPWYEKLTPAKGTYPWAWKHIRLGQQQYATGEYDRCMGSVRDVIEVMPTGPEKMLAIFLMVESARRKGDKLAAERYASAAAEMPKIHWPVAEPIFAWARLNNHSPPTFESQALDSRGFGRLLREIRSE